MDTTRRQGAARFEQADGERVALLRTLYDQHYRALVKMASFYVDDIGSCEEVVQDVFVAMMASSQRIAAGSEAAYLRSSVLNRSRSALRKRRVRREKQPPTPMAPSGPEADALGRVQEERLLRLLQTLPQRQADVLILRYYLDLTEAEIASTLDIAPGTVKSHAHRGLARLEELLENER